MKSSLINSTVYLNDQVIDSASNLDPYTVYVNPYYVVTGLMGGDRVSKHYYMNQQRVATDITINYDPNSKGGGQQEQAKGSPAKEKAWSPALTDFNEVLTGLGQKPVDTANLKLPTIASYYPEAAINPATSSSTESTTSAPRILFWYHPDYLGNVDLITERDGYAHEFFMYNPWGEEMHQWNANTYAFSSPYRFNAKELDPETGLAYYGARYFQNKLGVWLSVDPMLDIAPDKTPFHFVSNNPTNRIDPIGLTDFTFNKKTGTVTQVGEENNHPDRIIKTKRNGDLKYSKNGEFEVVMIGIEKGILSDGQNWKTSDQVFEVGGEGQPTVDGIKSFTLELSEYLGKEIKGFSYSSIASGEITDMVLAQYSENTYTSSKGTLRSLQKKYGSAFSHDGVIQQFHTHPEGQLGATQSAPNLSQDVKALQNDKTFVPNASFIILYRINGQNQPAEYDYTHEYKSP